MRKILRAYGPKGKSPDGKDWNWCQGDVVGVHGFVCDNSCNCGCNRSFVGISMSRACSRAVVEEVSDAEFAELRETLRKVTLAGWDNAQDVADEAVRCFDEISAGLHFPVGAVVRVSKRDDSVTLMKDFTS